MTDPAQSLFCGNVELELDNLNQQEREEEEQDREEAARLDAQLAEKMQGAFDDLDIETDDDDEDDESVLCQLPPLTRENGKSELTVCLANPTNNVQQVTT